jgi:hypothetical protein
MTLGSSQPVTEISTKNLPGRKGQPVPKADNLTAVCDTVISQNIDLSSWDILYNIVYIVYNTGGSARFT